MMRILTVLVVTKALLLVVFIQLGVIGLSPDEAQYWTWSRQLDWGYYSKPPGVAWMISLGTALFGDTPLGVRFGSLLLGSLLPFAVYFLARSIKETPQVAFWAGVVMALVPMGILASVLAITDVGMVLFWTLACAVACSSGPRFSLIGCWIALGALFKWPIYLLWAAFLFLPTLRRKEFFGGVLISLCGLLPSLYWNMTHEWATFRHVGATLYRPVGEAAVGNPLAFLGMQIALLSPVLFVLLLVSFRDLLKEHSQALRFCGGLCAIGLTLFFGVACFKKMQGNWAIFLYPTGIVWLAHWCSHRMLKIGLATSLALTVCVPFLPAGFSPFKNTLGWDRLTPIMQTVGYNPKNHFVFGDSYQTASILSFYAPGQPHAYFFNLDGIRRNQFTFWPGMSEERMGQTGYYFRIDRPERLKTPDLSPYFEEVVEIGRFPLVGGVKEVLVLKCLNYNGKEPVLAERY